MLVLTTALLDIPFASIKFIILANTTHTIFKEAIGVIYFDLYTNQMVCPIFLNKTLSWKLINVCI